MKSYRERLTAPVSWWLGALTAGAMLCWIFLVAFHGLVGLVAFVVGTVAAGAIVAHYGSLLIARSDGGLQVGRAFLEESALGQATALDRAAYRRLMTVEADARAYLTTRPYLDRGVRIEVKDAADPAPYWLVSSRHPHDLARAINRSAIMTQDP